MNNLIKDFNFLKNIKFEDFSNNHVLYLKQAYYFKLDFFYLDKNFKQKYFNKDPIILDNYELFNDMKYMHGFSYEGPYFKAYKFKDNNIGKQIYDFYQKLENIKYRIIKINEDFFK